MSGPTKYQSSYCDKLIAYMAQGSPFVGFGSVVNASKQTLYNWVEKYPEFAEAKEIGYCKGVDRHAKLMTIILEGIESKEHSYKKINATMLIFKAKTQYHEVWGEKMQVFNSGQIAINISKDDANL